MKRAITIENGLLAGNGERIPLISGEFHYWRVFRENWPVIVERIKEMGLEVVATYIPWNYHELAPGEYDFTGRTSPQRDLVGFLDLLKDAGIKVIIRPGPYIYAEWLHGGPPARAVKHDRMSPEFLAMARDYILAVCKVLAPRQITRGGNIILCQSDNEPYPPIESFGSQIGCFKNPGIFKEWLRRKYDGNLAALNRRWRTGLSSFDDACFYFHEAYVNTDLPMAGRLLPARESHNRYADCFEFIGWYAAEIVRAIGGYLREGGIEVPLFGNSWSPLYADFGRFCEVADLAGSDIYPGPFMEGAFPTRDNWEYNLDIVKMSEADVTGGNVWSAEFQSGLYPIQQGYLDPRHFKFVPLALMARGLKGWNWYMLVNRDNWSHCPINEWGRTNEYFPVHQAAVATARRVAPWEREPLYDVALCVYKPHRVIAPGNFSECFRALEEADLSYAYYNPRTVNPPRARVVLYAGDDWIDAEAARKLRAHVENGGTLIAFSRFPAEDESGESLAAVLPFIKPEGARPVNLPVKVDLGAHAVRLLKGGHAGRKVNFAYFRAVEGQPLTVTLSTASKEALVDIGATDAESFICGYVRPLGKGRLVYLGSNPSPELLCLALEAEGAGPWVRSPEFRVTTSLLRHRRDGSLALFVINRGDEPRQASVALNLERLGWSADGEYEITDAAGSAPILRVAGTELTRLRVELLSHDVAVRILRPVAADASRNRLATKGNP